MPYEIIQPPFSLRFREMPKQELRDYFEWFQQVLPDRVRLLAAVIQDSGLGWEPNYSVSSLQPIGGWLAGQVSTRPRTSEEMAAEQAANDALPIDISPQELTNRTFSLAMDIGMYFGEVLIRNNPELRWEQTLRGSLRFVDYGQPVVIGQGKVPLNPVRIAVTAAYTALDGVKPDFRELYDIWVQKLLQVSKR